MAGRPINDVLVCSSNIRAMPEAEIPCQKNGGISVSYKRCNISAALSATNRHLQASSRARD